MKKKHVEGWRLVASKTVLDKLDALRKEIPGVREARDDECVHRMRIASRRLRSALGIYEGVLERAAKKWRKRVRWVTSTLGKARDLDVQIGFLRRYLDDLGDPSLRIGPETLLERLSRERADAQGVLEAALDELESCDIIEAMRRQMRTIRDEARKDDLPAPKPLAAPWVRSSLRTRVKDLLSYSKYVPRPECVEELHEMRIAAKRLRYSLEAFAPYQKQDLKEPLGVAKKLQGLLGEIHDCDVWEQSLRDFLEKQPAGSTQGGRDATRGEEFCRGIHHLKENRRAERQRLYRKAVKLWSGLVEDGFWKDLLKRLRR
jgi:CHAD domain-containing protein